VKYQKEGVVNQDLVDIIAMNVRLSERAMGDLRAQITAVTTGERRFLELVERYGRDAVLGSIAQIMDHSEAVARANAADLVLWVVDGGAGNAVAKRNDSKESWLVRNKVDLLDSLPKQPRGSGTDFEISALTGLGLDRLVIELARFASEFFSTGESVLVTRERHRAVLTQTVDALRRAVALDGPEELIAEELRAGAQALGRLTGRIDVEDILDVIFRNFCIGK